jgi:hypothetical protein
MAIAIEISDEQYRVLNEMRRKIRTGRRTQIEPFKEVMQRILDAYVPPGKD